jgi:hypothetical protein
VWNYPAELIDFLPKFDKLHCEIGKQGIGLNTALPSSWAPSFLGKETGFPTSTNGFETVLIGASAKRLIDRIDDPSQSMVRIWVRLARGGLFMPQFALGFFDPCKQNVQFRIWLISMSNRSDNKFCACFMGMFNSSATC